MAPSNTRQAAGSPYGLWAHPGPVALPGWEKARPASTAPKLPRAGTQPTCLLGRCAMMFDLRFNGAVIVWLVFMTAIAAIFFLT